MAALIMQRLVLRSDVDTADGVQFYLNNKNEIFVSSENEFDAPYWFFTFDKDDWETIKAFIDGQLQEVE